MQLRISILYILILKQYGDDLQFDLNSINFLKQIIRSKYVDVKTYKLLNIMSIDIVPEYFQ